MALTDKAKKKLNRKLKQKINQEEAELAEQQANLDAEKELLKIAKKNDNENEIETHKRRIERFEGNISAIKERKKNFKSNLT